MRENIIECKVYTAKDVAKILNCSLSTAYLRIKEFNKDYVRKNKLNPKILMSRVSKVEFDKYLENSKNL